MCGEANADEPLRERSAGDDYDLLTFAEAGTRLAGEVAEQQARLDELRAHAAPPQDVAAAGTRLEQLRAAAERIRKPRSNALDESGFFGRRGE